jgi:hypothetical protein
VAEPVIVIVASRQQTKIMREEHVHGGVILVM